MVHEDGGAIIPMFANYLEAGSRKLRGFVPSPALYMSGLRAPEKVWFEA
jgi:peptide/nickel transport system substrate-binding protein